MALWVLGNRRKVVETASRLHFQTTSLQSTRRERHSFCCLDVDPSVKMSWGLKYLTDENFQVPGSKIVSRVKRSSHYYMDGRDQNQTSEVILKPKKRGES